MLFNFWLPLMTQSSEISEGNYRFSFNKVKNFDLLPNWTNKNISVEGRNITITETIKDLEKNKYLIVVNIKKSQAGTQAKMSAGVVAIALLSVIGLGLLFMNFEKVEKLIDSPTIQLGVVAIFGFILIKLMKSFKK